MNLRRLSGRRALAATVALTSAVAGAASSIVAAAPAAQAFDITSPTLAVTMRGNGHGHGLSQYGAEGAAAKGLGWRQIVNFYYPNTSLHKVGRKLIRVKVSDAGTNLQVAATHGLEVSGVSGWLPTSGVARYRLLSNNASGLRLQVLPSGSGQHWRTIRSSLGNGASFHSAFYAAVRVFHGDGTSIAYSGFVRAVRKSATGFGGGTYAVNLASLDNYVAGVTPREMPASWRRAALDAQSIAARTYASWQMGNPQSTAYDICDSTMCQVYGGVAKYDRQGNVLWSQDLTPARDTAGQVLYYGGKPIFAQFSASNGGWTVDGGQPYLVAKADPYDSAVSGDPYLGYTHKVAASSLAGYFKLSKVTKVAITHRDGHGSGGGRATAVTVWGYRGGKAVRVNGSGFDLQYALGAGTTWLSLRNA